MKKILLILFTTLMSVGTWATTYKLTQVSSVSAGEKYVFVQDTHAMIGTVSNSALQTVEGYKTTGLTGTEDYVWTLETAKSGFYMKNVTNKYLTNSSSTTISFSNSTSSASIWEFNFTDQNYVLIQNISHEDRVLGYTTATSYVYKAYAASVLNSYPHAINVYKLEAEGDDGGNGGTPGGEQPGGDQGDTPGGNQGGNQGGNSYPGILTINVSKITNPNSLGTYGTYNWTDGAVSGVYNGYSKNGVPSLQFNYDSKGSDYHDLQAVYNTIAVPGKIKSIKMVTTSDNSREWTPYVGISALTPSNYSNATSLTTKAVTKDGTTWNVTSGDYRYFYLDYKVTQAGYISEIVISYEATVPVTIGAAGWATYVTPCAVDFTNNAIEAYAVSAIGAESVTLTRLTTVPANEAIIVKGTTGAVLAIESADAITNLMQKTTEDTTADGSQYILANVDGEGIVFAQATESSTIAAGKGYITLPGGSANLRMEVEGDKNAVENVTAVTKSVAPAKLVKNGQIFVMKNGRMFNTAGAQMK